MTGRSRPVLELGYSIADRISLLYPSPWTELSLTLAVEEHSGRIAVFEASVSGGAPPLSSPWCDRLLQVGLLNHDIDELKSAVLDENVWLGTQLFAQRCSESSVLVLLGPPLLRIEINSHDLMTGTEFLLALNAATDSIAERQRQMKVLMGPDLSFSWSLADRVLRLGSDRGDDCGFSPTLIQDVLIVGSFAPKMQTWCWSWANPDLARYVDHVRPVYNHLARPILSGQGIFRYPESVMDPLLAESVAALAAHRLGGRAYLPVVQRNSSAVLYLAILLPTPPQTPLTAT